MAGKASEIIERLAAQQRVLILGGIAVIAHGLSRTTEDADVWLDPMESIENWCNVVRAELVAGATLFDVSRHREISPGELEEAIDLAGMVRVGGLDRYLDIFYQPNQLDLEDFDAAWKAAHLAVGSARVMDESFLIATKADTGRQTDAEDLAFLETKLRSEMKARLEVCALEEAERHFSRYVDHTTCLAALKNPDFKVQKLGLAGLEELAADDNPFAVAALKARAESGEG